MAWAVTSLLFLSSSCFLIRSSYSSVSFSIAFSASLYSSPNSSMDLVLIASSSFSIFLATSLILSATPSIAFSNLLPATVPDTNPSAILDTRPSLPLPEILKSKLFLPSREPNAFLSESRTLSLALVTSIRASR